MPFKYLIFIKIITFDRFWSIHLSTKLRITRNKTNLTILIFIILGLVSLVNLLNVWYDAVERKTATTTKNSNHSIATECSQSNLFISFWQTIEFILMRSVIPLGILTLMNVVLLVKIRKISMCSIHSVLVKYERTRQRRLTLSVCFSNTWFLFFNLPMFVYFILFLLWKNENESSQLAKLVFLLFERSAFLFSCIFTLHEFLRDLTLNRYFRREVIGSFMLAINRRTFP